MVAVKKATNFVLGGTPRQVPLLALSAATTHQPPPKLISDEIQDNEFISLKLRYPPLPCLLKSGLFRSTAKILVGTTLLGNY